MEALNSSVAINPEIGTTRRERWITILKIAWPLIIANSFWNLQLTADRVFLGHYSTQALGAAMAVMGVFWTVMALLQQTSSYVMTFVAQYYGAKRYEMVGPAFWSAIYISIGGGLIMLGMIPFADQIFEWTGHSPDIRKLEVEYFIALCYSGMPTALVAAASGFYTGLSNTKTIMGINCVGFVANLILCYLMIFGNWGFPEMGIRGAGYATAIANWAAAFFGLYKVFTSKEAGLYHLRSGWRYSADLMKRYVKYGVPSGMQWALEGLAFTIFLVFVGRMANGSAALAASGIVVTVMTLAILPAMGVAQAVSVLVGQYLGEKNPQQAEISAWSGLQVAIMYIATMGVTFISFPGFYLSWFHNSSEPELWAQVTEIVPYIMMMLAVFSCFDSMNLIFSFSLKGAGDTKFVTLVALLVPWPIMVIPTYFLQNKVGAIYWAWGAASIFIIMQALVFWRRFVGGKWKSMSVIN